MKEGLIQWKRPFVYPYQSQILDSPARYTVCEASTKVGKTASHIIWLFEKALQGRSGYNYWWVAPVFSQAEIAFKRMAAWLRGARSFIKTNKSKMYIELVPLGVTIHFKSADQPDNLYGDDVYAVVFDEYTRAKEDAWVAIRSVVTKTQADVKFIGNCKGRHNWYGRLASAAKQYMVDEYQKAIDEGRKPKYQYFKITCWDAVAVGLLSKEEVEDARDTLPEDKFKELYLAEPAEDGLNPFGLAHIEHCLQTNIAHGHPVAFGVDIGNIKDYTVVTGLNENGKICYYDRFRHDMPTTHDKIHSLPRVPICLDGTGIGAALGEEMMIQRGEDLFINFKFSGSSKPPLMSKLIVGVQKHQVGILDNEMRIEFEAFEKKNRPSGIPIFSAPEGVHDDTVMALALAWKAYTETSNTGFIPYMSFSSLGGSL